jgi:hypothetical protein
MPKLSSPRALFALAFAAATLTAGRAHADDPPSAADPPPSARAMRESVRSYYDSEMTSAYLFVGYGAVTAAAGGVTLTQGGDFARGFGLSSLVLGGVTALGGAGYGVAVKVRGGYYTRLAGSDLAQFKLEEAERLEGTNRRFWLYLGSELLEAAAGIGLATYGVLAKDDLWKGVGLGAAIQGIGLFAIDVPGAGRAARYRDDVRRFDPKVGLAVGGGDRPWAATVGGVF